MMRHAVWIPLFDEWADPLVVARLAASAEEAGWDGFFVWDQLWWRPPVTAVADPWITLSAVAVATERLRIGPMVTPVARRRPVKLLRETTTLDRLGHGRLTLGASTAANSIRPASTAPYTGLGSDRFAGEFSRSGEEVDDRVRAARLDECLDILTAGWAGETVNHRGEHYLVDAVRFEPRPVAGRIPIWCAGFPGNRRPIRRAARYDGFFPVNLTSPDQVAAAAAAVSAERGSLDGFDLVIALPATTDNRPYAEAGATWCLTDLDPADLRPDDVRAVVADGPPR